MDRSNNSQGLSTQDINDDVPNLDEWQELTDTSKYQTH